jgi:hypothetical protein
VNVAKVVGDKGSGVRRLSEKEREREEGEGDKKGGGGWRDSQTKASSQGLDLVGARMKGTSMTSLSQNLCDKLENGKLEVQGLREEQGKAKGEEEAERRKAFIISEKARARGEELHSDETIHSRHSRIDSQQLEQEVVVLRGEQEEEREEEGEEHEEPQARVR